MFNLLFGLGIVSNIVEAIKESCTPTIPAENWANKDLIRKDIANNVSAKQRIKNAQNGKYKVTETYPEPHRNPKNGKIVIENSLLFKKDCREHGAYQAYKWAEQGRYNLTPEELEAENKRIKESWDYMYSLIK